MHEVWRLNFMQRPSALGQYGSLVVSIVDSFNRWQCPSPSQTASSLTSIRLLRNVMDNSIGKLDLIGRTMTEAGIVITYYIDSLRNRTN